MTLQLEGLGENPLGLAAIGVSDRGLMGFACVIGGLFAFSAGGPFAAAIVGLVMANDIRYIAKRDSQALRAHDEIRALMTDDVTGDMTSDTCPTQAVNPASEEKFRKVQAKTGPKSSAKSSADDSEDDSDNWTDTPWSPPAPDLSLLPIKLFKEKVTAGTYQAENLAEDNVRGAATGRVFDYLRQFSNTDNIEYLVWWTFGLTKGGNDWYSIAADFCRQCRDHYQRTGTPPNDNRVTW